MLLSEQPLPLAFPICCWTCLLPDINVLNGCICLVAPCFRSWAELPAWNQRSGETAETSSCVSGDSSGELLKWAHKTKVSRCWDMDLFTVSGHCQMLRSVAHLCLPDIDSFYQIKWHATAELKAIHSLFNDEVQQVITSLLRTAGCPTPGGLRGGKWLWSSNLM